MKYQLEIEVYEANKIDPIIFNDWYSALSAYEVAAKTMCAFSRELKSYSHTETRAMICKGGSVFLKSIVMIAEEQ